ncbi:MAG TPA: radical SAM protein [Longimicrobiales bacterium]|nr:radical SAM protein [Longimicrobiales bacterium]
MKVLLVSVWRDRYDGDGRARELPSLSVLYLAALVPKHVEVEVWHEHVRPLDLDQVDADIVGLSAMTGAAVRMYDLADKLRERGHTVFIGGPHASLLPQEAAKHADAVAVGEGDRTFPQMIADFERGQLKPMYVEPQGMSLEGLPPPRYDLLEDGFIIRGYVQATRGCPFHCTFCTLKSIDKGFRTRPVDDVLNDIAAVDARTWLQRKFVWFWDDNLTGNRAYARELFTRLKPLKKWWWSQLSIDLALDRDLVRLAAESGALAVFVGVETFSAKNLLDYKKRQNRVDEYKKAIQTFHDFGIAVHAGLIVGMDEDTEESIRLIPEIVEDLEIDLPFVNVLTPFPSTPLYHEMEAADRLLGLPWERHNANSVTFLPNRMTPEALEREYWDVRSEVYSIPRTMKRMGRTLGYARFGGLAISGYVNSMFMVQNAIKKDRPWETDRVVRAPAGAALPA